MPEERNQFVDSMRGVAMLLVVLGHTMTGCTAGAEESFLFNIVWSLQMPLFFLISGYVTRYSRGISDGAGLWAYCKRRTLAYLLPWIVWSFFVRGVVFRESAYWNVPWLLWHMDTGYWFLASIWTISMVFGLSVFAARKLAKDATIKRQIFTTLLYLVGMGVLLGIGWLAGLSFFAMKLTLYYMPFYFAGYLYGQFRDRILSAKWGKTAVEVTVAVCLAAWLFGMTRFRLYSLPDGGAWILLRAALSLAGCIAVCGLCKGFFGGESALRQRIAAGLSWTGVHSLEIYLVHYLLLNLVKSAELPPIGSMRGAALVLGNYALTLALTALVVKLLHQNRMLRLVLFGKTK
ncbi:MAG: acyltransferase [Clostridia bacterium]|nr:acyltransferase [Clostridia bacterium]